VTDALPPEPREIKPHPYGVELGRLVGMLKETKAPTVGQFFIQSFSRVSPGVARRICEAAKIGIRCNPQKCGREEADALYKAIQETKIPAPATDCLVPIGEELILKGLHQLIPGEFYAAATRPPSVYRGNPFLIEVGLAYGGTSAVQKVSREALVEMIGESDARTLRQFLSNSFDGVGPEAADKIIREAGMKPRVSPGNLDSEEIAKLHEAMRNVNLSEGQSMNVMRYANRVPLQFQAGACAITQTIMQTNWRSRLPVPAHRQRLGALHQRVEGGGGRLSGDPEGDAPGPAGCGPEAGDVPTPPRPREARGPAAADLPSLSRRSGRRRQRHQQGGPPEALRSVARSGEKADRRGRHTAGRPRPAHRGG
jgi:DNA topoisomerase VI subunit B